MTENIIRVMVENPEAIFKTLSRSRVELLINFEKVKLPLPGKGLEVGCRIHPQKNFSIEGIINTEIKKWGLKVASPIPVKKLSSEFPISEKKDLVLILNEGREPRFEITKYFVNDGLIVKAGKRVLYFIEESSIPPPLPLQDFEQFKKDITDFSRILEILLSEIYKKSKLSLSLPLRLEENSLTKLLEEIGGKRDLADVIKDKIELVEKPGISFSEIGGQKEAKREIQGLGFALKNPELYKKWGTVPPKGILLYGPPGTGKTLMAKALASETEAKFLHVKVTDITSKWYGESEKLMQAVFDLAKQFEKCIVFFDEIDALAKTREESHEATQRVLSVLLENLDGMKPCGSIIIIGSTNRLNVIDTALTRAGRFDRLIELPLPDEETREEIFEIHIGKTEKLAERALFEDLDFSVLVSETKEMSGADIAEILRRTLEEKVRKGGIGEEVNLVSTQDIINEIKLYERKKESQRKIGFVK